MSEYPEDEKPDPDEQDFSLNATHRCDKCGAQAFVIATNFVNSNLYFCGHHYAKYEIPLMEQGFMVIDERHMINDRPSVSASEIRSE